MEEKHFDGAEDEDTDSAEQDAAQYKGEEEEAWDKSDEEEQIDRNDAAAPTADAAVAEHEQQEVVAVEGKKRAGTGIEWSTKGWEEARVAFALGGGSIDLQA